MLAAVHLLLMLAVPALALFPCAMLIDRIARARALRWHAQPVGAKEGESEVRGKIVVRGDARVAAKSTHRSTARNDLVATFVEDSERAPSVSIVGEDGEIELTGAIEVVRGSRARWGAHAIAWTVEAGDVVRAFGRLTAVGAADLEGGSYRGAPGRRKLEPAAPKGAIRVACDTKPQIARMPAWRQPLCFIAALPFWWFPLGAVGDLSKVVGASTDTLCRSDGACHAIPTWRDDTLRAAAQGWLAGHHFAMGPASDADCRASELCTSNGDCAVGKGGFCHAARDEDCRQAWGCTANGACSFVGGRCAAGKDDDCALTASCQSYGTCSAVNGTCGVGKDADCASTDSCASWGACSAVTDPAHPDRGAMCRARDVDCEKTETCHSSGQCAAQDGLCTASEAGCKASAFCESLGMCSLVNGQCAVARPEDCYWSSYCGSSLGKCRATRGGCTEDDAEACRVRGICHGKASEKSCQESLGCKDHGACRLLDEKCKKSCVEDPDCVLRGQCTEKDGHCVAGSDEDCRKTADCAMYGRCSAVDDFCAARTNEDCEGSYYCRAIATCTAQGGQCARASDEDCKRSRQCASRGQCTLGRAACTLLSDADCALTTGCAKRGECSLVAGKCVAAKDADCAQSEACKRFGWCVAATGPSPGHERACFRVAKVE
jgi:hypothetical protein